MADLVIPAPPMVVVPVQGGGFFPVRRVYCVGRNYAEHAREMGHDSREPPFFFDKPADALVIEGGSIAYPPQTADFQHEIELVVAIGQDGTAINEHVALDHVYGYAAGLDMTRRDLQAEAKKGGRPWTMAKGFDQSAPIGAIAPASRIGHPDRGAITLSVNGAERQRGDLACRSRPASGNSKAGNRARRNGDADPEFEQRGDHLQCGEHLAVLSDRDQRSSQISDRHFQLTK